MLRFSFFRSFLFICFFYVEVVESAEKAYCCQECVWRLLGADFRAAVEGSSLLRAAVNHRGEPGQFAASCASPEPKLPEQLVR